MANPTLAGGGLMVVLATCIAPATAIAQTCFSALPCQSASSASGDSVRLENSNPLTTGATLQATSDSATGTAVEGANKYGTAVHGSTRNGRGVVGSATGTSPSGWAGYFDAPNGASGVYTNGPSRVQSTLQVAVFNGPTIDVMTFGGALGDGVRDDTDAIQRSVDHAVALGGGVVYFPHGTYRTSRPIDILSSNIELRGVNQTATLQIDSSDLPVVRIGKSDKARCAPNSCANNRVSSLSISRSKPPVLGGDGIVVDIALGTAVNDVVLGNHDIGISIGNPEPGRSVDSTWMTKVTHSNFYPPIVTAGIKFLSSADSLVSDCYFGSDGGDATGILMDLDSNGIRVDRVTMLGGWRYHVKSTGSGFARFIQNSIFDSAKDISILLEGATRDISILGVWISQDGSQSTGGNGVLVSGVSNLTIMASTIQNQKNAAITMVNASDVVVSGNILISNVADRSIDSIYVMSSWTVIIVNNRVVSSLDRCSVGVYNTKGLILKDNLLGGPGQSVCGLASDSNYVAYDNL